MTRPMIVVVDSDDAVIQLMEELLDLEGYATHAVYAHSASVIDIEQAQPDLMIIEASHRQPGATLDLVDQIRRSSNTPTMPIIVNSTSRQVLETLSEPLTCLGCVLLEKPFDVEQFLQCVSSAMQTHAFTSETVTHVTCT